MSPVSPHHARKRRPWPAAAGVLAVLGTAGVGVVLALSATPDPAPFTPDGSRPQPRPGQPVGETARPGETPLPPIPRQRDGGNSGDGTATPAPAVRDEVPIRWTQPVPAPRQESTAPESPPAAPRPAPRHEPQPVRPDPAPAPQPTPPRVAERETAPRTRVPDPCATFDALREKYCHEVLRHYGLEP